MKLPFKVDLSNQVVAITGAGGIICGEFAKALAEAYNAKQKGEEIDIPVLSATIRKRVCDILIDNEPSLS